jgi:hypothetical protein
MNKDLVITEIQSSLKTHGTKSPGPFDLPEMYKLKTKLENATSLDEVQFLIKDNASFIKKAFGVTEENIENLVIRLGLL